MKKAVVVNVHAAKTHFSKLLEQAAAGAEIVIAKAGRPVARLVPFVSRGKRILGADRGRVVMADSFDAPLPNDVLSDFER